MRQVWHPVTLRSPEWDAKQFGTIKSLYLSAFDERTSPPFGQTGVAFFIYRPQTSPLFLPALPMQDELDIDEFGNMLDDAPTTPTNPYGEE